VERFIPKKLSIFEVRKQYQFKISNMFTALENLIDREDINGAEKNIKESIKIPVKESQSLYGWKQHKPYFDEECLNFWTKGSRLKCSGYRIQTRET